MIAVVVCPWCEARWLVDSEREEQRYLEHVDLCALHLSISCQLKKPSIPMKPLEGIPKGWEVKPLA